MTVHSDLLGSRVWETRESECERSHKWTYFLAVLCYTVCEFGVKSFFVSEPTYRVIVSFGFVGAAGLGEHLQNTFRASGLGNLAGRGTVISLFVRICPTAQDESHGVFVLSLYREHQGGQAARA